MNWNVAKYIVSMRKTEIDVNEWMRIFFDIIDDGNLMVQSEWKSNKMKLAEKKLQKSL